MTRPVLTALCALVACVPAQVGGGDGCLVVAGGGPLPEPVLEAFVRRGGGTSGRLVVVPTASVRADDPDAEERILEPWRGRFGSVAMLHTRDRARADEVDFVAPLDEATAVWIGGGDQRRIVEAYGGTRTADAVRAVLARGGVVGGSSAGAACMSDPMIEGGRTVPVLGAGLGLLPGVLVDQHFIARDRMARLQAALRARPGLVGLGIDEGTALVVEGRVATVVGASRVVRVLAASTAPGERPLDVAFLAPGERIDLPILRRAAEERAAGVRWPRRPAGGRARLRVEVDGPGSLVVAGGGRLPQEVVQRFLEAAGGSAARVVVVTAALGELPPLADGESRRTGVSAALERAGAEDVVVLDGATPDAYREPEALAALARATGVWFGGGRQWRIVEAFDGTPAGALVRAVVQRGGVVGGSSAGATIQGEYLVRGHPLGNRIMMAEGFERGLGLLRGVAIDQHFTERGRRPDLEGVVERHPVLTGLGVDEGTALVARGTAVEVLGQGSVTVLRAGEEARVLKAGDGSTRLDPARR